MQKNKNKQYTQNMKRLLKLIENNEPLTNLTQYDLQCLEECANRKYITGVSFQRMVSNRIVCYFHGEIKIEKAGLDFLYPPKNWTLFFSAIAAIGTVLAFIELFF